MMKRIIFLFAALLNMVSLWAIPAKRGLINARQPDGTEISIFLQGDENNKRAFSSDGLILTSDSQGFYVFAELDSDGLISPTTIREINPESRSQKTQSYISRIDQKQLLETLENTPRESSQTRASGLNTEFPTTGMIRSLVILVEFADLEFSIPDTQRYYSRMLNEEGFSDYGHIGSARDYYLQNSGGLFLPQFDVYGPVKLSKTYDYYGKNDQWGNDMLPQMMVIEACTLLDDEIDFSIYDVDNDGIVDNIYVFYAGYGEADGGGADTIWPHAYDIMSVSLKNHVFDGKVINHYACSNELQKNDDTPDGIGTFCHEFGHVLGLPDLYATNYSGAFTPGAWDIFDYGSYNNNSRTPPNFSSYERYAVGWLEPEILTTGYYRLSPLPESNKAYIVPTRNENEYFLLENRQQIGFDSYIPGHGMLIWHIDYEPWKWDYNIVNNSNGHQNVDIIEADNIRSYNTLSGDPFPGSENVMNFSCQTTPAFVSWEGESIRYRLLSITESYDGLITFASDICPYASINDIEADGLLTINGNEVSFTQHAFIYDLQGKLIAESKQDTVTLPKGLYIAVSNGKALKFLIR